MEQSPIIHIRNLNHHFGDGELRKQVLYDINLEITLGEIVLVEGPSGSGKTTLLTLLGGLRSSQEGSLKVLGEELNGARKSQLVKLRRRIGYIFQAHNLIPALTARQNVQMAVELEGGISSQEARRRAEAMLFHVSLEDRMDYYPEKLSGGQKQRVAIARALVGEPQLLLADEPTASLDKQSGRDVANLIKDLSREQGCTIVLVTHDNRILDIADRIISMEDGHLFHSIEGYGNDVGN